MIRHVFLIIFLAALYFANSAGSLIAATECTIEKPLIQPQLGHSGPVQSVSFSPDGRYALSGSQDQTLKLWDISSGREVRSFQGHSHRVFSIAFSPDGMYALSGSEDKTLKLWDINSGIEIRTFKGHSKLVFSVAFSPDGKYALSGSQDNTIKLWDISSGEEIRTFVGHSSSVQSVAFSPDGKYALSGSKDNTIKLWDISNGREIRSFRGHTDSVDSISFSPDGRYVLSGSRDKTLKLWNFSTGRQIRTFKGHSEGVFSAAISTDGRYALSGSRDNTLKLWNISTGRQIRTFKGHSNYVNSIVFSRDGRYALSGSFDDSLKLWDVNSGRLIRTIGGFISGVDSVAFSPDGSYALSGSGDKTLKLWDINSGKEMRTFKGHSDRVSAVAFSPNGSYALSGSYDKTLILWDINSGRKIQTFKGHSAGVNSVAFSPDGRYALSGSGDFRSRYGNDVVDNTLKLWDIRSGRAIRTFRGHSELVFSVTFSPDGKYALSGSQDNSLKLWEISSGKEIRTFTGDAYGVHSVAFSPDGRHALSGNWNNILKLWDIDSGREIRIFKGHSKLVESVAFSPDGRYALSGSGDNTLKIWDTSSGDEIRTFEGHTYLVNSVAFSPNGRRALSGSYDGTVRQWDINTGRELAQFISFTDGEWVTITPEGYYTSSENGDKHLNVRIGNNVYGIDQYREAFYRPDLVKIALAGGSLQEYRNIASVKQPPQVRIIETPDSTGESEAKVTLQLTDMGGGIGDVRLYLNGSAVLLDDARGLKVVAKDDGASVTRNYTVKLINGKNSIRAVAFNADNTMQSNDAQYDITASFSINTKPSIHALVIGIDLFKNPNLELKYPVADAELFAETLGKSAAGLFERVNIRKLTTKEETTSANIKKELAALKSLNSEDVFIFYVASHGTVDDGEYFLITSNVGSTRTEKLKTDALSQRDLKELIANIPATKKLIVIDTCNAEALGDAMQVAMMTRGMSENTAMKILSRAVGTTILSASTSVQEALEGYEGHGVFTWVLTEGLRGKADKGKSGFVKTTELADYVDTEVPLLAEKVFKRAQYPTVNSSGQGFPIGQVR
jgi:WD40 repeat protein